VTAACDSGYNKCGNNTSNSNADDDDYSVRKL